MIMIMIIIITIARPEAGSPAARWRRPRAARTRPPARGRPEYSNDNNNPNNTNDDDDHIMFFYYS